MTLPIFIGGTRLLSKDEPSIFWDDVAFAELKAYPEDVFYSFARGYADQSGSGTVQTWKLWERYREQGLEHTCRICNAIFDALLICSVTTLHILPYEHIISNLGVIGAFINSTSLQAILIQGWGAAFGFVLWKCMDSVAWQFVLVAPENASFKRFQSDMSEALRIGFPGGIAQGDRLIPVDYARAWKHLQRADYFLRRELVSKHGAGVLLDIGALFWQQFYHLGLAWNHGGVSTHFHSERRLGASVGRTYSLVHFKRVQRHGWSLAIVNVAMAVAQVTSGLEDLELLVVMLRLSDAPQLERWSRHGNSNCFNVFIPEETALFDARLFGLGERETGSLHCRTFAQYVSLYTGCSSGGIGCDGAPGHMVPNLRLRCPVPWKNRLQVGQHRLKLAITINDGLTLQASFLLRIDEPVPRKGVTICVQPHWDHEAVNDRWHGLRDQWLDHHLRFLQGIDQIFLYDTDGTLAKFGPFPPRVNYFPEFPGQVYTGRLRNLSRSRLCNYCAENLAYDHCLMSSRSSDYIVILHGLDEWLVPVPGAGLNLAAHLDIVMQDGTRTAFLDQVGRFTLGGNVSANLPRTAIYRFKEPRESTTRGNSVPPNIIIRPYTATYVDTHVALFQPSTATSIDNSIRLTKWFVSHFIDFMVPIPNVSNSFVEDRYLLDMWAKAGSNLNASWYGTTAYPWLESALRG